MTAKIINLRHARKQKARSEKERRAEQNRAKYGRTKGEKQRDHLNAEHAATHLDGHKLERGKDGDDSIDA